jgi:hypothetical protein
MSLRLAPGGKGPRSLRCEQCDHDWTDRYPLIVKAALKNRSSSFVIDGETVLLGVDGVSDFDGLHSGKHDAEVQLYTFDCLALDGDDLRKLPLSLRKTNLARLLARRPDGIFVAPFEQGEIGPDLFRRPASSASRAWYRNIATAPIAPALEHQCYANHRGGRDVPHARSRRRAVHWHTRSSLLIRGLHIRLRRECLSSFRCAKRWPRPNLLPGF